MKRYMTLFLAFLLVLCASSVFGSGKSDAGTDGTGKTITLQVWGGVAPQNGPVESMDEFNALFKDKGIQAEYVMSPNDDNGNLKLETTLLSGDAIDVYVTYGMTPLVKRIESKMAMDLTDLIKRDNFNIEGFGDLAKAYAYNSRYYGIPTKVDLYGIMINKNVFDAAGISIPKQWTYSQFKDIAKRLTRGEGIDKFYGMFLNTQQDIFGPIGYFATSVLGGDWMYSTDGKASGFDSPLIRQTMQLVYDMMHVDKSAPTHIDSVTQKLTQQGVFLAGKSAMCIGPWITASAKDLQNYPHDFMSAFAPYPTPDGQAVKYSQGGAGDIFCINPKAKNTEAAWEYVKWYSTKGMLPVASRGRIPLYDGYNMEEVTTAFMKGYEKLFDFDTVKSVLIAPRKNYAVGTITTKSPEIRQIYQEEIEALMNGIKTVDKALADGKARADRILAGN